jgi:hypothetical protein
VGVQEEVGTKRVDVDCEVVFDCSGDSILSTLISISDELVDDELGARAISAASGEGERGARGSIGVSISGLISGEMVSRAISLISVNDDSDTFVEPGRLLLTISLHTILTYFGVAPRRMSTSGLIPSCIKLRIMSIYCLASSSLMPGCQVG